MSAPVSERPPEEVAVPAHVPAHLVHRLDHHNDAVVKADPIGFMDELRERYRVFYSPVYEGFWAVTRYEDQRAVLQQHEMFSSSPVGLPGGPGYGGHKLLPLELDPPEHSKYRALLNPVFAPRRIRELEAKARQISNELIDRIVESGRCEFDFVADYAAQFPTRIFVDMMGLPMERYQEFLHWNNALLHSAQIGPGLEEKRKAGADITAYLTEVIRARRRTPGDDLVSVLLASTVDGEQLSDEEVLRSIFLLFMAGLDTVMSGHTWLWWHLARQPQDRRQIVEDPSIVGTAMEELLRYHSFVNDVRTARADFEFAGVQMKKGDRVWLHGGSSARDPREFPDAHLVDLRRSPNRHTAFGAGPHRCAGSHLARLEMRVTLEEWHKRIPDYRIPEGAVIPMHCGGVAGLESLPLEIETSA